MIGAKSLLLGRCRGHSSVGRCWIRGLRVIWVGSWETVWQTHTLRDAGENGGNVKLEGKLMSWLLEDCDAAAPHTASNGRNVMNETNPALCMLNHENRSRTKKGERKVPTKYMSDSMQGLTECLNHILKDRILFPSAWVLSNCQTWRCDLRSVHRVSRKWI